MIHPIAKKAFQQIGTPQERTIRGRRAAQHQMITTARARVPSIEHEFLGTEASLARLLIKSRCVVYQFTPTARGIGH